MKVLIGLDDSRHSEYLTDAVIRRKWPHDTQFKIVSVIEPLNADFEEESWISLADEVQRRRKEHAEEICENARRKIIENVPQCSVHFEVRKGDACCELINTAVDWTADKMLVGAHSKSICPHNLMGSVSRAVSLHAPCSVEVIREKAPLALV